MLEVGDFFDGPGHEGAEAEGCGDPDDGVDEGRMGEPGEKDAVQEGTCHRTGDFFEEHHAECHIPQENPPLLPDGGQGMAGEPVAGKAEYEGRIEEQEGIIKPFRDWFCNTASKRSAVPGHGGRDDGAGKSGEAKADEIFLRNPGGGQYIFDPVADQEIEGRLADGKDWIEKAIDFRASFKDEERNDRNAAHKDEVQTDEVKIKLVCEIPDQDAPDGEHEEECYINIEKIIGCRHGGGVGDGEEPAHAEVAFRESVEENKIDQGEHQDHLHKSPDPLPENGGDRFFLTEKKSAGNHKENGDSGFHPEWHSQVQRKPGGILLRNVKRKSGGGRMGKHDKPYAERTEKFNVHFFLLGT